MGDLIILIILVIMTHFGYRRGFLRTLTGVISILLAFVLAISFSPKIEDYIKTTEIYTVTCEKIENNLIKKNNDNKVDTESAEKLNLPRQIVKNIKQDIDETKEKSTTALTNMLGGLLVKIISILLIFIAVKLLLHLLLIVFGFMKKMPVIGWFDGLLGALFGFLKGLLAVYILLVCVTALTTFNVQNKFVDTINHSEFAKVMYNNNVFLDFIKND